MSFLRKSLDTAVGVGRMFHGEVTRQVFGHVCPRCNNLSPYNHYASSNQSMGFLDDTSISERATYASGAVWLRLDFKLQVVAKALRKMPCMYCKVVLAAIQRYCPDWFVDGKVDPELDADTEVTLFIVSGRPVEVYDAKFGSFEISDFANTLDGEAKKSLESPLPHCGPLAYRAPRSDDSSVWDFWREAMDRCSAHHPKCRQATHKVTLPKRLVDVGEEGPAIRLVETKPGEQGRYAALSHCWGGGYPLRTVKNNLQDHKAGLAIGSLNANFSDVVVIARKLGLKYVWIDSLCIVQDVAQDWEEQASQMATIYQNATVTTALGSSSGPEDPVLCDRDADWNAWDLEFRRAGKTVSFKTRRKVLSAHYYPERAGYSASGDIRLASDQDVPFSYIWPGPLYTRAWCLQEQLLSNRMMHYTPGAVIWECQTERRVEGEDAVVKEYTIDYATEEAASWTKIVENYSKRDITYDTDRLFGLAGAAQDMAMRTNYHYLAGMWKETLFWNVLWHPHPFEHSRPSGCGAPSWSWASLTGTVHFGRHYGIGGTATYAEIKHSGTIPRSLQAPFADVESGYIILEGPIVQARLYLNVNDEIFPSTSDSSITGLYASWEKPEQGHYVLTDTRLYETELVSKDGQVTKSCRRAELGEPYHRDWTDCDDEPQSYDYEVTVLCFWHTKALDVCGLVLAKSASESVAYSRVAQVFKVPLEYVKRARMETIKIL